MVAFGFCVPMDHIIKTTMTRYSLNIVVDDKPVGKMLSCGHATFKVASGYSTIKFVPYGFLQVPHTYRGMILRPGKTQYLYLRPAGDRMYTSHWVSKAEADKRIGEIKQIGQIF